MKKKEACGEGDRMGRWERWSDRGIGARRKRWRDRKEKRGWMEGWIRKKRVDGRKQRRDQEKEVMQEAQREKEGWVEI